MTGRGRAFIDARCIQYAHPERIDGHPLLRPCPPTSAPVMRFDIRQELARYINVLQKFQDYMYHALTKTHSARIKVLNNFAPEDDEQLDEQTLSV
jgi:hypothetical protein